MKLQKHKTRPFSKTELTIKKNTSSDEFEFECEKPGCACLGFSFYSFDDALAKLEEFNR